MSAFDADAETVEAPELKLSGELFRGRVISVAEWMSFKNRLAEQEKRENEAVTPEVLHASECIMLDFLRLTFPPQNGVDPIAEIERRGHAAIRKLFVAFFGHSLLALGFLPQGETTTSTNSTGASPAETQTPEP